MVRVFPVLKLDGIGPIERALSQSLYLDGLVRSRSVARSNVAFPWIRKCMRTKWINNIHTHTHTARTAAQNSAYTQTRLTVKRAHSRNTEKPAKMEAHQLPPIRIYISIAVDVHRAARSLAAAFVGPVSVARARSFAPTWIYVRVVALFAAAVAACCCLLPLPLSQSFVFSSFRSIPLCWAHTHTDTHTNVIHFGVCVCAHNGCACAACFCVCRFFARRSFALSSPLQFDETE